MSLDDEPRLIMDAIALVGRLGFRYLWIDRYCIPQNDDVAKHTQIQMMGQIYAESILTIVVAAGIRPEHGIPGVDSTMRTANASIKLGHHCLTCVSLAESEIGRSRWNTRGWTYQEALLSRGRLVFTDSQVYFQCFGMHRTDAYSTPSTLSQGRPFRYHKPSDFGKVFPDIIPDAFGVQGSRYLEHESVISQRISEFWHRDLSVDNDALDAIVGIFASYGQAEMAVCGLPLLYRQNYHEEDTMTIRLANALLWETHLCLDRRPCFPSWTWAGWKPLWTEDSAVKKSLSYTNSQTEDGASDSESCICQVQSPKFTYSDGRVLHLEEEEGSDRLEVNYDLLCLSGQGIHPISLTLSAWTFHCCVCGATPGRFMFPSILSGRAVVLHNFNKHPSNMNEDRRHDLLGLVLAFTSDMLRTLLLKLSDDNITYERVAEYTAIIEEPFAGDHSEEGKVVNDDLVYTWREVALR